MTNEAICEEAVRRTRESYGEPVGVSEVGRTSDGYYSYVRVHVRYRCPVGCAAAEHETVWGWCPEQGLRFWDDTAQELYP